MHFCGTCVCVQRLEKGCVVTGAAGNLACYVGAGHELILRASTITESHLPSPTFEPLEPFEPFEPFL